MSASAIAAARLKNARERRLQEIAGELGVLSAEASRRLHTALLAHDSGAHALNPSSRFEPLMQDGVEHALSVPGARLFSSHKTFQLPRSDQSPGFDTVHHLVLAPDHSAKLNEGLKQFALVKERQAKAASRAGTSPDECRNGSGALPHPKNRSTAGVLISNEGGFQSYSDLFDYADLLDQLGPHEGRAAVRQTTALELNEWGRAEFDEASVRGRRHCHELHRVASAALDELGCTPMANAAPHSLHPENPSHSLHRANAWLNVNRATDNNIMHMHNAQKWSATYYVAAPPETSEKLDGRLLFRSGTKRRADGQPSPISHSFMTVPPDPGSLWLFPGSVPHRVLGFTMAGGGRAQKVDQAERGMWAPRISIAINFIDAMAVSRVERVAVRSNTSTEVSSRAAVSKLMDLTVAK